MKIGTIGWQDLTVQPDKVEALREFYEQVIGWESDPEDGDYNMIPPDSEEPAAGICRAIGVNADLPPQWLVYIIVESVQLSLQKCLALGGTVITGPRDLGGVPYCVIRDPAGAVCALYEATKQAG